MPDLEMLLRDLRPVPDPAWASKLDARVAAGFPTPPSRWERTWDGFRAHFLALGTVSAVASVLILFVVVIAPNMELGGGDDEAASGGSSAAEPAMALPETAQDSGGSSGGGSAMTEEQKSAAAPGADRAVLKNASITLSARPDQVETIADRAIRIVDTLGGYVATSEINRGSRSASATLTLRIPTADLDKGLAQISKLAHVSSRSQEAQDVTDQRERLESLVRDARADREGLRRDWPRPRPTRSAHVCAGCSTVRAAA